MNIYVSSKFSNKPTVKKIQKLLGLHGHHITEDWTNNTNAYPCDKHQKSSRLNAVLDANAIRESDIFIYVTTKEAGIGSSTEFGIALHALQHNGKPEIYVVGKNLANNIFFFHPLVKRRNTIEQVIREISS